MPQSYRLPFDPPIEISTGSNSCAKVHSCRRWFNGGKMVGGKKKWALVAVFWSGFLFRGTHCKKIGGAIGG